MPMNLGETQRVVKNYIFRSGTSERLINTVLNVGRQFIIIFTILVSDQTLSTFNEGNFKNLKQLTWTITW